MDVVGVFVVARAMLSSGDIVIVRNFNMLAEILEIPNYVSNQWVQSHRMLLFDSCELLALILEYWASHNFAQATIGTLVSLLENQFVAASDAVSKLANSSARISVVSYQNRNALQQPNKQNLLFGVHDPISTCVPRNAKFDEIYSFFSDNKEKCVVVNGFGGEGKTEFVKMFIKDLISKKGLAIATTWLEAVDVQHLLLSVSKLLSSFSLPSEDQVGKPLPCQLLLEAVVSEIKNRYPDHRWVVVLDNVEFWYQEFHKAVDLFMKTINTFTVIITRKTDIYPGGVRQIRLNSFEPDEACLLVKSALPDDRDDDIGSLCASLGNHPLALQQVISYIWAQRNNPSTSTKGSSYNIQDFVQEFQQNQRSILSTGLEFAYQDNIHRILQTTMAKIIANHPEIGTTANAASIVLALFNPEEIHFDTLHSLLQIHINCKSDNKNQITGDNNSLNYRSSAWRWVRSMVGRARVMIQRSPTRTVLPLLTDQRQTNAAVLLLARYSLVTIKDDKIYVHRLVQMVQRIECDLNETIRNLLGGMGNLPETASEAKLMQIRSIWEFARVDAKILEENRNFAARILRRMQELSLHLEIPDFVAKNWDVLQGVNCS